MAIITKKHNLLKLPLIIQSYKAMAYRNKRANLDRKSHDYQKMVLIRICE
jgi:hypothetical protein